MSEPEKLVFQTLTELFTLMTPGAKPVEGDQSAVDLLKKLDTLKDTHRENLNPQLLHYLERRSYEKALAWLNDPTLPHQA